MPELPSHTYTCRNKGCQGERQFQGAPPEWFQEKGLSTPTNCRTCRVWLDGQTDEDVTCTACSYQFRVPKGVKIMFHRNEGVWISPVLCKRARRTDDRKRCDPRTIQRADAKKSNESIEKLEELLTRKGITPAPPISIDMIREIRHYKVLRTAKYRSSETLYEHILFDETNGGHRSSLSNALQVDIDAEQSIVDQLARIAHNSNPDEVFQFRGGKSAVKIERSTGILLIINSEPRSLGSSTVSAPRTAFVPNSPEYFAKQVHEGKWTVS